ncbi:MAG: radical SAM protein [Bacillota bacterium]
MEFIKAKTILQKVKYGSSWYGIDYSVNLYKGCSHGCIYCDSRSSCYNIEDFDRVRGKENALDILENELNKKKHKGIIGIGSMSDTYNPHEKEYEITRGALKLFAKYGFGVSIDTKSPLILRDIDILKQISQKNNVIVKFTVTTPLDRLSKIIEPCVSPASERLAAIKELSANNIFAGIMLNPVLPFITDDEQQIKELVRSAAACGAKFIHSYMGVTLRSNQRDYYYKKLDEKFPGLKAKYIQVYGNNYFCPPKEAEKLCKLLAAECEKYGILYKMPDIIKAYKTLKNEEQLTLF